MSGDRSYGGSLTAVGLLAQGLLRVIGTLDAGLAISSLRIF